MPCHAGLLPHTIGIQINQPLRLNACCHSNEWQWLIFTVLSVYCDHKLISRKLPRYLRRGARRQQHMVAGSQPRNTIREPCEYGHEQSVVVMMCLPGRTRNSAELLDMLHRAVVLIQLHGGEEIIVFNMHAGPEQRRGNTAVLTHPAIHS